MAIAPRTRYRVPTMAGKMPPALPESSGGWVRNVHVSAGSPWMTISCRMMIRMARTIRVAATTNPNAMIWICFWEIRSFSKYHAPIISSTGTVTHQGAAAKRTIRNRARPVISATRPMNSFVAGAMRGFRTGPVVMLPFRCRRIATAERLMTRVMRSRTTATPKRAL